VRRLVARGSVVPLYGHSEPGAPDSRSQRVATLSRQRLSAVYVPVRDDYVCTVYARSTVARRSACVHFECSYHRGGKKRKKERAAGVHRGRQLHLEIIDSRLGTSIPVRANTKENCRRLKYP